MFECLTSSECWKILDETSKEHVLRGAKNVTRRLMYGNSINEQLAMWIDREGTIQSAVIAELVYKTYGHRYWYGFTEKAMKLIQPEIMKMRILGEKEWLKHG